MKLKVLVIILFAIVFTISCSKKWTKFEAHGFKYDKDGKMLLYRLLKPKNYDMEKKYPLVIFLHGSGERGSDNKKQLMHGAKIFETKGNMEKYPCFVIAPQCPEGQRWVEVDWNLEQHTMPENPSESVYLLMKLIDSFQKRYSIDESRIYVTGLSMGGFGTWDLLARYPEMFSAGAPVCGGADVKTAKIIKDIPIWGFHGALDKTVNPNRTRDMIKAIKDAGGNPKFTEYDSLAHNAWDKTYGNPELLEWMFGQEKLKHLENSR
ncbi:MAG: prolyl oligopeptidase family serine peptidase [Candidatus Marinimicrobia bacterium]|nr:prolyl oligopeptidase family serine peptidase [Candidatus Neomarinimicrobiota bacterium]